ncbi:MAG: hypothetical protein RR826_02060, partial [Christensenellaceae bacterium]
CSGQKDFVSGALVRVWYAYAKLIQLSVKKQTYPFLKPSISIRHTAKLKGIAKPSPILPPLA